jgi:hypothetical protein
MTNDELVRRLVRDLRPVRRLCGFERRALLWAAVALGWMALVCAAIPARPDLGRKLGDGWFLAEAAALVTLFVASARSAFRSSVPGLGGVRSLPLVVLGVWVVLVGLDPSGASLATAPPRFFLPGSPCAWKTILLVFAPALAAFAMLRRAAPLREGWTGLFALLACGALAMLGTQVVCRNDSLRHVLIFHVGAVLAAAAVGVAAGRLLLPRRRSVTTLGA